MTGQKRSAKTKVYSAAAMVTEESENETALQAQDDLTQEGDEDAALINDFECTAAELIQDDPELAPAYSAYVEARKRLSEKHRNRGFWPTGRGGSSTGKGKGFSSKGTGKVVESQDDLCRIGSSIPTVDCGRREQWRAECPYRPSGSSSASGHKMDQPQLPHRFLPQR